MLNPLKKHLTFTMLSAFPLIGLRIYEKIHLSILLL
nr:MAG TPA: transmembrane protein [Caudoviricetes sp.]